MAKYARIRITKNDRREHAKLAKNAKAKIKRTAKNHGIDLSGEINIPSLDSFNTRSEYNDWKRQMASFLDRSNWKYQFVKNKNGVSISRSEKNKLERKTKVTQERAKKEIERVKKLPFISGGKQYGTLEDRLYQMKDANELGIYVPPDFNFDSIQNLSQLNMKRNAVEKRLNQQSIDKRMDDMKGNFIKVLRFSFNSDADELVEKIDNIPSDDFLEIYRMFDEFDFALYRSPKDEIMHTQVEDDEYLGDISQMLVYIDKYERGELNFDMKGFDR